MRSNLYEIQDVCMQFAHSLSVMMRVDVEIVDRYHKRVAATGHFLERLNQSNINEGHAYSDVLENGTRLYVENPSRSHYCQGCREREFCEIKLEIGAPIIVDSQIEGVIGLTCWDEKQKEYIISQYEQYTYFLDQMCSLIADKIKERRTIQKNVSFERILHTLTPLIGQGVMILDDSGKILDMNSEAMRRLNMDHTAIGTFANVVLCGTADGEYEQYKFIIGKNMVMVPAKEIREYDADDKYSRIMIMQTDGHDLHSGRQGKGREVVPIDTLEKEAIFRALQVYGSSEKGKQKAADALGIGISTLYRKLKGMEFSNREN